MDSERLSHLITELGLRRSVSIGRDPMNLPRTKEDENTIDASMVPVVGSLVT
jgi:hypothetical protein